MDRQNWTLKRKTGPLYRAVEVRQLKADLNLAADDATHDEKLGDVIDAAVEQFEADTDRICISSTFELFLDYLDAKRPIDLIKQFAHTVDSISYLGSDDARQTVDPAVYSLSAASNQVLLAINQAWPEHRNFPQSVIVTFQAGHATPAEVPRLYKQAIKCQAAAWWLDPAMEQDRSNWMNAYERLILRLLQSKEL